MPPYFFFPSLSHWQRLPCTSPSHFLYFTSLSLSLFSLLFSYLFLCPHPILFPPFSLFLSFSLSLYSHRWWSTVIETIMEQNLAEHAAAATLCSNLKRSESELALAEFIRSPTTENRDTAHPFAEELDVIFGDGDLGFSFKHKVSLSLSLSLSLSVYIFVLVSDSDIYFASVLGYCHVNICAELWRRIKSRTVIFWAICPT